jgi:hypothetical protein
VKQLVGFVVVLCGLLFPLLAFAEEYNGRVVGVNGRRHANASGRGKAANKGEARGSRRAGVKATLWKTSEAGTFRTSL